MLTCSAFVQWVFGESLIRTLCTAGAFYSPSFVSLEFSSMILASSLGWPILNKHDKA